MSATRAIRKVIEARIDGDTLAGGLKEGANGAANVQGRYFEAAPANIPKPHIAVCGLNPHAGENGQFGDDEERIISPAILMAIDQGIHVTGPYPGDTVFMQARQGRFDVVVAQYHDQGLIPVKYLGLEKGVNITLGLPLTLILMQRCATFGGDVALMSSTTKVAVPVESLPLREKVMVETQSVPEGH